MNVLGTFQSVSAIRYGLCAFRNFVFNSFFGLKKVHLFTIATTQPTTQNNLKQL
jgi:hypothetical protein